MLQEELVTLRRILPDKELVTLWSIGRLMPSGTMTAVAVAVGHRLCGFPGTVVALIAMIVPGFTCVVVLTIGYGYLAHGAVLDYIDATLLPAALGIVVISALRLGRPLFRFSLDTVFVVVGHCRGTRECQPGTDDIGRRGRRRYLAAWQGGTEAMSLGAVTRSSSSPTIC